MSLGMIGKKAGMTRIFDSSGMSVPVTAISITPNHVSQIKTLENDGYRAIQVSYGEKKETHVNKPIAGHYKKVNLKPGEGLVEFRLENEVNQDFKVGDKIDSNMFKEGEHVDITGTTIGKGFQGGVKRHHFKMQDATHGNSLSHRALGSTGQCQDPGRVFKGKKMAGQLGNNKVTIQNLVIVKIIPEENTLLVKGSIPGFDGANVIVRHTKKKYIPKKILDQEQPKEEQTKEKVKTKSEEQPKEEQTKEKVKTKPEEQPKEKVITKPQEKSKTETKE